MASTGVVIAESSMHSGGTQAVSYVGDGYTGRCEVCDGSRVIAVVRDHKLACRIAAYAIGPNGGYYDVAVFRSDRAVTHQSLESWIGRSLEADIMRRT